jgi:hypothetical protein
MKTLQEQYNLIQENRGDKEIFTKQAKKQFSNFIPNSAPFSQTLDILKDRGIINENIMGVGVVTSKPSNPDWFKIFNQNINEEEEVKINNKKPSDQVTDLEEKNYNYTEEENIDNNYGESFLKGFYYEMNQESNKDKSINQVKEIVNKNLGTNRLYYVENGQFGVDGVGYTKDHPGLTEPQEPKGEWKGSGYGDLEENKTISTPTELLEQFVNKSTI